MDKKMETTVVGYSILVYKNYYEDPVKGVVVKELELRYHNGYI